jgi:hypothetical protein
MVSGVYYGMQAQHTFQVKYVWSNMCGGAKREDVDQQSRSEMSEQSGADWNNRNKIEKGVILLQEEVVGTLSIVTLVFDNHVLHSFASKVLELLSLSGLEVSR